MDMRIERDTLGEIAVPKNAYWGAQTQRSYENFKIGNKMPCEIIHAFAVLKKAAAIANNKLGTIDEKRSEFIGRVCDEIMRGELYEHFPLVIYQTGSGTQSNMNVNEVIANRGNELAKDKLLHPNDHVNKSQSSNDTFPTAMNIAAVELLNSKLIPACNELINTFNRLEEENKGIIKTGRTHLQDATPITLGQEISGWKSMIVHDVNMIKESKKYLLELALGGTAVGTGLNAPKGFDVMVAEEISKITNEYYITAENKFHSLTSKDGIVYVHGAIKALASDMMKIANDVRWLSSGPRCGIGEITIPANEPGSSIMPGKVNPTQCEAMTMVSVQVMGNDTAIGIGASQGNFQLNVFMPVIISNFIESCNLLAEGISSFNKNCVVGIKPNIEVIDENLNKSLMVVTALNPYIGYEKSAEIAKKAFNENISLKEAGLLLGYYTYEQYDEWMDFKKMTRTME